MYERRPGWFWPAVVAAILALSGGAVVAVTSYLSVPGPDHVVRSYFAALTRGDAQAALGYGDVPQGDRSFLTTDVLDAQLAAGPITGLRVAPMSQGAVPVTYSIGGTHLTDLVPVRKRDGQWRLTTSAVPTSISLADAQQRATIDGAAVPTGQPLLFPGALPIQFDAAVLTVAPGSAVVRFAGSSTGSITAVVSAAGARSITSAVTTLLTTCLTASPPAPDCPVPSGTGLRAVPQSLHGAMVGAPTISISVAPQADGKLAIAGTAHVDGSYQRLDYQNKATTTTGAVDVAFTAHSYATDPLKIVLDAA
jgi:hypothetical protein